MLNNLSSKFIKISENALYNTLSAIYENKSNANPYIDLLNLLQNTM